MTNLLRKDLEKTLDVLMTLFDDKSDLAQETDLIRPLIVEHLPNEVGIDEEFHNSINNFNIDEKNEMND